MPHRTIFTIHEVRQKNVRPKKTIDITRAIKNIRISMRTTKNNVRNNRGCLVRSGREAQRVFELIERKLMVQEVLKDLLPILPIYSNVTSD